MTPSPISWPDVLSSYPGATLGEKLSAARSGMSFTKLAVELKQNSSAVKALFYRSLTASSPIRRQHVTRCPRPDYASILGTVIEELAGERGFTAEQYRERLQTTEGQGEFQQRCCQLKIPVFVCEYQERRRHEYHRQVVSEVHHPRRGKVRDSIPARVPAHDRAV